MSYAEQNKRNNDNNFEERKIVDGRE